MKTISAALDAHFGQEVTSLCTCWKIVRTDGVAMGFTSHDTDLTIDDLVYDSAYGYSATAVANNSDMSVDNMDVTGILDADSIATDDLRNGLFNFASVYVFVVNWQDLTMGSCPLRRGWFGEVTTAQNGMFHAELRGLNQALSHNYVESFTPECRADFCDARCKLSLADFSRTGTVFSAIGVSRTSFIASALPPAPTVPTSVGAHKDWRIFVTAGSSDVTGFSELIFWDQSDAIIAGGTVSASSTQDKFTTAADRTIKPKARHARDSDDKTMWVSKRSDNAGTPNVVGEWLRVSFGAAVDVKEFMIGASVDPNIAPTSFTLQYSDDNGSNWIDAKPCTAGWNVSKFAVWVIGSEGTGPINNPDSRITVPPPYTGASTYVGGTVTFKSGRNRGKTTEIIGYDAATQTITLFDGVPYVIVKGDTFTITQGCDQRIETCKLYNNVINFRGEPDVPGQDEYLSYPDA